MNISQVVFAGNQVSEYRANILLFDSTVNIYDVHFLDATTPYKDCHVYIVMLADDFANKASCMTVDSTNKSFLVIDLSDRYPVVQRKQSHQP
jgi:hypothetical protein